MVPAFRDALVAHGESSEAASTAVEHWVADRGTPVPATLAVMDDLGASGIPVFVFTNGTDNIPAELHQIGLGHLVDVALRARPGPGALRRPDREHRGSTRFGWQAVHFDADVPTDV